MSNRAHGRGAIAAVGFVLVFAGLVGGAVLWYLATQEPDRAADEFARAAPGCTTTIAFAEARDYFVYEELSGVSVTVEGCEPTTSDAEFAFVVRDPAGEPVPTLEDGSITYDLDAGQGRSVARITIPAPGDYAISVVGNDPAVVAAIGPDPQAGVQGLRRGAIAAAAVGLVLGGLLLWVAGRRSRRAATFAGPVDPGWGVTERDHQRRATATDESSWLPPPPDGRQVPINPHKPDERRVAGRPVASDPYDFGWAPPAVRAPAEQHPLAAPDGSTLVSSELAAGPSAAEPDEESSDTMGDVTAEPDEGSPDTMGAGDGAVAEAPADPADPDES